MSEIRIGKRRKNLDLSLTLYNKNSFKSYYCIWRLWTLWKRKITLNWQWWKTYCVYLCVRVHETTKAPKLWMNSFIKKNQSISYSVILGVLSAVVIDFHFVVDWITYRIFFRQWRGIKRCAELLLLLFENNFLSKVQDN